MKIEMDFERFKHWKDVYSRDAITKELWNTIDSNQYKEMCIDNQDKEINNLREKICRLDKKIKLLRKKKQ